MFSYNSDMKIWHTNIIPALPRQLLLALHRDICAIRGNSWGKCARFLTWPQLYQYHTTVMGEMERRGWKPAKVWKRPGWRGRKCAPIRDSWVDEITKGRSNRYDAPAFPETQQHADVEALQKWARKGRISPEDYLRVLELFS